MALVGLRRRLRKWAAALGLASVGSGRRCLAGRRTTSTRTGCCRTLRRSHVVVHAPAEVLRRANERPFRQRSANAVCPTTISTIDVTPVVSQAPMSSLKAEAYWNSCTHPCP